MQTFRDLLIQMGWTSGSASIAAIATAFLLALLIGRILRALLSRPLASLAETSGPWHDALKRHKVRRRIAWVIVTIATQALVLPLLESWPETQRFVDKTLDVILVVTVALAISGLIGALVFVLQVREGTTRLPFKVLGQGAQITVLAYASVAVLSVLTGRDVITVLTGLTAIGAILVYIFRDPILGWTSGIQIAANDLVRVGDWITFPPANADGNVEEISITSVKVHNWDKTVSSIPTYSLISQGFRNWRGMYESGGRRIKRAIAIDAASVRFCDESLLHRLTRNPLIRKLDIKADPRDADADPLSDPRPTNLSCFRAWLNAWLERHPKIHEDMLLMVREMESEGRGIPVEIYVFSNDQRWEYYEKIQAEIIDHVLAVLPLFDLRIFQEPTGKDLRALAVAPDRFEKERMEGSHLK